MITIMDHFITLDMALVNLPVIFLQILAARAVEDGGNSLITVFKPNKYIMSVSFELHQEKTCFMHM